MHKVASENPDSEIVFDFYDDTKEILANLQDFFEKNPDLMPKKLILRLHFYNGGKIQDQTPIHGTGEIDNNYQNNIKFMLECADIKFSGSYTEHADVSQVLIGEGLQRFKGRQLTSQGKVEYASMPEPLEEKGHPARSKTTGSEEKGSFPPSSPVIAIPALAELERISTQIFAELDKEIKDFFTRKKVTSLNQLSQKDAARYKVMTDLSGEIRIIKDNIKKNIEKPEDRSVHYNWKEDYKTQLTHAVKASLKESALDKYNPLEKIGIGLLNLICFVLSPFKYCATGTWFYSFHGKPKEAVQDTEQQVKNMKISA
jgi:hypothetical protein